MAYHCPDCKHPSDSRHGMAMHLLNSNSHPDITDFATAETEADGLRETSPDDSETREQISNTDGQSNTGSNGSGGENPDPLGEQSADNTGSIGIVPESDQYENDEPTESEDMTETTETDQSGVIKCPGCNASGPYNAAEYLEAFKSQLNREHINTLERGEYVCRDCGGVW